jgi:ATP-dependent helicase HrpB
LGALQENGMLTVQGRQMVRLPVHPRLAHMLVQGAGEEDHRLLTDVAALLSEPDVLRGKLRRMAGADLAHRLSLLATFRNKPEHAQADHAALRHLDRVAAQFRGLCPVEAHTDRRPLSLGAALLLAYPDRLAQCSPGEGRRYLLRSGRAAMLRADDPLIGTPYLVAASVDAGKREGLIHLAAAVALDEIKALCEADIDWRRTVYWDQDVGDIVARQRQCLGSIVLQERPDALQSEDPIFDVLAERIGAVGLERTFELPSALLVRVELMRRLEPDRDWPDFTLDGLTACLAEWLLPWLAPGTGLRALSKIGLDSLLRSHLGRERCQQLDDALPQHITTPAGTQRRIAYALDAEPVLALPMQELFGERIGPRLAGGRVRLVFHLLSPAGRPLQVTSDLAAFWAGAYHEVKKEMRGRYPKHHWPDDPANTPAGRSLKKR